MVRGESNAASCTYAEKVDKKSSHQSNPRSDAEDMRKRLNCLENSILSMMESKESRSETPAPSVSHMTSVANVDNTNECPDRAGGQTMSTDSRSTHWDSILNEVGFPRLH